MKAWQLLLCVPVVAAIAMMPQDPKAAADSALTDVATITPITELQYISKQGTLQVVSARNVVEIRLHEECEHSLRLELLYDNGDYSLIDAQSFHILRNNGGTREVRLVRAKRGRMRFPQLP